ncbi:AraC family transcriptional regulator [Verminephrobacter eiseniae]|uniref:AraC family transcriptional regulator n=1 Tax=Verminephrobacter eiseniae TaxID=364317 RepID=UPI0010D9638A|nr:AraC family transcriptional regulator [Verminephrobacter eiseniae]KAB7631846.1 AraC family transcriptional regulator [Verminephrobacter sp. Larva24]MCW5231093.1 AraC family transcriptional regulator [Verminephrobacter eiseniae]MCW5292825.1 AraC family transcriptional regulator [Verminephrobacter eiseniae]MCW8186191.1 AraC family transcriptional regulator [Verminephrobacter eiseniae]MCW8224485.1 AraC family transcriptional regulator [Verminephrobacter eiseniae]
MTASLVVGAISLEATRLAANRLGVLLRGSRCGEIVRELASARTIRSAETLIPSARRTASLLHFTSLLEIAAKESGRIHLGLDMAGADPPHEVGIVSGLFLYASTVGQALEDLVRFFPIIQTGTTVRLACEQGIARFIYSIQDPSISDRLQDAAYTLGKICRSLRRATGDAWSLEQVTMAMPAPASLQAYTRFFRAPVVFNAQATALCFPAAFLALPIRTANAERYGNFCAGMAKALPANEDPGLLEDALRAWMKHVLRDSGATLEHAAADFGITPRTLQRRLRGLGIGFVDLRAQVRMETARRMLVDSRLSVACIAEQLGFSEPSAFTRAFRRHTRQSPRAFRQAAARLPGGAARDMRGDCRVQSSFLRMPGLS